MKKPNLSNPDPIELAKLAAILCPNAEPEVAMKRAMEFYIEATLFVSGLPKSFDALMAYAGEKRKREHYIMAPLRSELEKAMADTLELDPAKDNDPACDPARQYLAERGLKYLKKARTVLDNFRRCYNFLPKGAIIKTWKRVKDGRIIYDIPRCYLDMLANQTKSRRAEQKKRSWQTRKAAETRVQKAHKEKISKSSVRRGR